MTNSFHPTGIRSVIQVLSNCEWIVVVLEVVICFVPVERFYWLFRSRNAYLENSPSLSSTRHSYSLYRNSWLVGSEQARWLEWTCVECLREDQDMGPYLFEFEQSTSLPRPLMCLLSCDSSAVVS